MKNVMVTGGCGFIGSHFIDLLLEKNDLDSVVNVDNLTYAAVAHYKNEEWRNDSRYFFYKSNILNEDMILHCLKQHQIDTIVHFAAESHVDFSINDPRQSVETNVMGTLSLLRCFVKHVDNATLSSPIRFHHVSTDEVFGSIPEDSPPVVETTVYNPSSPYSAGKAASDHLVHCFYKTYQLPVTISHCTNNFGTRQHVEKLIPKSITNFLNKLPIEIYGNGMQRRDWLYVKDHCAAIDVILRKGKIGENYNISANLEIPNLVILEDIFNAMQRLNMIPDNKQFRESIVHVKDRPGHDIRYALNHDKLSQETGWKPGTGFDKALEETIQYYFRRRT